MDITKIIVLYNDKSKLFLKKLYQISCLFDGELKINLYNYFKNTLFLTKSCIIVFDSLILLKYTIIFEK